MPGLHESGQHQAPRRVPDAVRPVLCPACGICQTVPPASGSDVRGHRPVSRRTDPAGGSGLSSAELLGTPLSAAEQRLADLALSYPHLFGE